MNRSQRIKLNYENIDSDKHIKVKLERNMDTFEFLTMNVDAEDVYKDFNSDYGVLVGRVIANGGIGIPNAKISIFIPLSEEDENNGQIRSIYPYKTPRDENIDGKRYNLLPRVSKKDPETNQSTPKQPFGSFPIKEEIVTNESILEVYKKYYKYTTLTNNAGDYMIFGVPVGTQTVHLSVDITDIGEYSMNPASMVINLGYSENLFVDDNTKIKPSNDLNDLPNIETQEISVDIIPFWGDAENFEIGITQQNFRIRSTLNSTFTIFGSVFTDGENAVWGADFDGHSTNSPTVGELNRIRVDGNENTSISSKRIGKVKEKIYYYPNTIPDAEIDSADPKNDMLLLDSSEYSVYKRDGDFVFIINCNRNKVITDDLGNLISVDDNSVNGVFTEFSGFLTLEITPDDIQLPVNSGIGIGTVDGTRFKLKFPQFASIGNSFDANDGTTATTWRKQYFKFEKDKFYSLSKFHGTVFNENPNSTSADQINGFLAGDHINNLPRRDGDPFWNSGNIVTGIIGGFNGTSYEFPNNYTLNTLEKFGANWLNLCVHLPQFGRVISEYSRVDYLRVSSNYQKQIGGEDFNSYNNYYFNDNSQEIAAGDFNTKWFARSDLHWTDFIEVPLLDIQAMNITNLKGFRDNQIQGSSLTGQYRNGTYQPSLWPSACPINGGKINGDPAGSADPRYYFYKGHGEANCIQYLYELGLVD